jgi:hypothetical protein
MPVALLLLLAAPQKWSYDVGPAPLVKASNVAGTIRVEAVQGRGVGISAEASGGTDEERARWTVETRGSQSEVSVRVCCGRCGKRGKGCGDAVHFDLVVRVPEDAHLELSGVSSRVSVAGVAGAQSITTVAGEVEVEGSAAALRLSTVSGKISVRPREPAPSQIHSVTGEISLVFPPGAGARVSLATVSGRLNGDSRSRSVGRSGPRIAVDTVSGDVTVVDTARSSR